MNVVVFIHLFIVSLYVNSVRTSYFVGLVRGYFSGPRTMPSRDGYSENIYCLNNCHPPLPVFQLVGACEELGIHSPAVVGCLALFPVRRKREFDALSVGC